VLTKHYFAFVHPYILYGLEVYANTFPSYLDKLTVLNNKFLRILQKKGRTCCNESLYLQYTALPPVQLFNYQVLNLVHKTVFSPYLLYSTIILLLLALFTDMKLDTTHFI